MERVPDIDTYIADAPAFARPILTKIRAAFHAGCPELEERIKWGVPSFEYKGILGGMAAFRVDDDRGGLGHREETAELEVRETGLSVAPRRAGAGDFAVGSRARFFDGRPDCVL